MQRIMLGDGQIRDDSILLTDSQSHYLRRVLRLGEGDRFIALDGQGMGWIARLGTSVGSTLGPTDTAQLLESWQTDTELAIPIHLMIAMPKTGMDDVVRQATELGVAAILPVVSDRTILKPSPKKIERWRRIAQEAIEQCERQWVPVVHDPANVSQVWSNGTDLNSPDPKGLKESWGLEAPDLHSDDVRYICVARSQVEYAGQVIYPRLLLDELLKHTSGQQDTSQREEGCPSLAIGSITLSIGPEGGWTPEEIGEAIAQGYTPVSLGPRILRAVTAPLGAIAIVAAVIDRGG